MPSNMINTWEYVCLYVVKFSEQTVYCCPSPYSEGLEPKVFSLLGLRIPHIVVYGVQTVYYENYNFEVLNRERPFVVNIKKEANITPPPQMDSERFRFGHEIIRLLIIHVITHNVLTNKRLNPITGEGINETLLVPGNATYRY